MTIIQRLEALSGPYREVDEIIFREHSGQLLQKFSQSPPAYTASLDAALLLVPEGWQWLVSNRAPLPHTGRAYIHNKQLMCVVGGGLQRNPDYVGHEFTAATPAIALTIAALEARGVK